ncbi:AfsR/SARP family transcriptional regulator [Plantactinospora sonchi]|uniref:BTAD domain-containing putative transcriptional regulator n=1 Tax=Plantactinospora sonchi TaxID=1544735 RepID=A0ABU7RNX3_9ACTN
MSETMMFGVLGQVRCTVAGRPVDLGPARQRTVLAALAVDAGSVVSPETIIDRVWDDTPPGGARSGLYSYIARLRRLLEAATDGGGTARLFSQPGGYLLDVPHDAVDLHRFQALCDRARAEPLAARKVELLDEANDLWRGEAFADLRGEWIQRTRRTLRQQHVDALLLWTTSQLELDRTGTVINLLRPMLDRYPLVEPLAVNLIDALRREGRSAEALETFGAVRQRLADELGADPGPELRRRHELLLSESQRSVAARAGHRNTPSRPGTGPATPSGAAEVRPVQLPSDLPHFVGRVEQLGQLDRMLIPAATPVGTGGTSRIATSTLATICGPAGAGKTALVVRWAYRAMDRFPDGLLYANLRGFAPDGSVAPVTGILTDFLGALGVAWRQVPQSLDAQAALYRSLTHDRRMLVVLDDARDADQIRPLLPGGGGCSVVITSRTDLSSLITSHGAGFLTLDVLSPAEARELLACRLGADRVSAEPVAVRAIVRYCGRLPLALSVVAARAATRPTFPLAVIATELAVAHGLAAFATRDPATDLRIVFSRSYATLSGAAADLFRKVGRFPHLTGPATVESLSEIVGEPSREIERLLAELRSVHLITESAPRRYQMNRLLRSYAVELERDAAPPQTRPAALLMPLC